MSEVLESIASLDVNTKVSEMTVGQFLEAITFRETYRDYHKRIEDINARTRALQSLEDSSKSVFNNVEVLQHATTPFEVGTEAELEKMVTLIKDQLKQGKVPVVALGFKEL